ncbi:inositol phosphorylceramide synthase [Candidatus Bathyarchaeota archaeon]|nr:inositol phosphorylceramide synthase [Candidatus Bathyarchaeota archaeon]
MGKKREEPKGKSELKFDYHSSRFFSLLFPVTYSVALAIFCLAYKILPGPEFLILAFLIYAAYNKKTWSFLKDWLPFITIFVSYEILSSVVGTIAQNNLHSGPNNLEMQLFGQIPSLILQQTIRMPILDYAGAFFYSAYFFVPTVFAFILWKKSPTNYWKYTVAFGVCTYGALITYLFYPVAPPWIAIPKVTQILTTSVDASIGLPVYKWLFNLLNPDLYAAFPSMHSALPWLVFLFAFKAWRWKALPVLALPLGTWFSAVYLGEHYVVDVLGGIAYGLGAFILVEKVLPLLTGRFRFLSKNVPKLETKSES